MDWFGTGAILDMPVSPWRIGFQCLGQFPPALQRMHSSMTHGPSCILGTVQARWMTGSILPSEHWWNWIRCLLLESPTLYPDSSAFRIWEELLALNPALVNLHLSLISCIHFIPRLLPSVSSSSHYGDHLQTIDAQPFGSVILRTLEKAIPRQFGSLIEIMVFLPRSPCQVFSMRLLCFNEAPRWPCIDLCARGFQAAAMEKETSGVAFLDNTRLFIASVSWAEWDRGRDGERVALVCSTQSRYILKQMQKIPEEWMKENNAFTSLLWKRHCISLPRNFASVRSSYNHSLFIRGLLLLVKHSWFPLSLTWRDHDGQRKSNEDL